MAAKDRIAIKTIVFVIEAKFEVCQEMGLQVIEEALEKLREQGVADIVEVQGVPQ
jgi:hypothetical protein